MDRLPQELVGLVFGSLDPSDVCKARAACRVFRKTKARWRNLSLHLTQKNIAKTLVTCVPTYLHDLTLDVTFRENDVARVYGFPNLQRLVARCCISRLSECLAGLPHLKHLELVRSHAGDQDVCALRTDTIEHLVITPAHGITNASLEHIAQMTKLDHLGLTFLSACTADGLSVVLSHQTNLAHLQLGMTQCISDSSLAQISRMANLRTLDLTKCENVTDAGLAHLSQLKHLNQLVLSRCLCLTDAGLQHVGQITSLHLLNFHFCTKVTDAGLLHVSRLANLRGLQVSGCTNVTDSGCEHLRGLTHLEFLTLDSTSTTDAGVAHIATLSNLQVLDLSNLDITDSGVALLPALCNLQDLSLNACSELTDACFAHLASLAHLEVLALNGCDMISLEALANFEKIIEYIYY